MIKDELTATEAENKKFLVKHNTEELVEPEIIIKIVDDIEKKLEQDKNTIEEANKSIEVLEKRLETLKPLLPLAKTWAKIEEKKEERSKKN